MKILENIPLKNLTTMRLGGPARYVIDIEDPSDIKEAYKFAADQNLPTFILGGGANTIAHDEGFNGVIIRNTMTGISSEVSKSGSLIVTAMSGEPWDNVVAFTTERGFTGIEALSKIPGLSGAAPVQNIGAYGQELLDTFISAEVYDTISKSFKTLQKSDFNFAYRHSILNTTDKNRYFVISITLELQKGNMPRPFYDSVERYIAENGCTDFSPAGIREIVSTLRANKLPDPAKEASAGSFFKNIYLTEEEVKIAKEKGIPIFYTHDLPNIYSGWLIEKCGLKGQLLHGMRVSPKAALILINESAKSYDDLAKARAEIITAVKEKFGYTLEQEPVEI